MVASDAYTVSHKIEISKNGGVFQEFVAPLDISEYVADRTRSDIREKLPIEFVDIGHLYWKISRTSKLLHSHRSVLSPLFYSFKNGYKLRLQLDLISPMLHLLMMSSENDASLLWPFLYSVDFGVLSFGISDDIFASFPSCRVARNYSGDLGNVATSLPLPPDMFRSECIKGDNAFINCHIHKAQ